MGILNDVTKTIKSVFSSDDEMIFDDSDGFEVSTPNPFSQKSQPKKSAQGNKPLAPTFDLDNHGFNMARTNQNSAKRSNGKIQIYVPKTFEEAFTIIKDVKAGFTAMVNVEVASPQISQRIIDVVSGAIFALDGDCKKMGEKQYIFSLSADTIGAYDYLPVNGEQVNQQMSGFNFSMGPNYDPNVMQGNMQMNNNPFAQGQNLNPNNFAQNNYNQNNFNENYFNQNAEKAAKDLQNFYVPPKSQF